MTRRPACRLQRRLWFFSRLYPGVPFFITPLVLRLTGEADHRGVQAALRALTARHDALRTCLADGPEGPEQAAATDQIELTVTDLSQCDNPRDAWDAVVAAETAKPLDLASGPLLRAVLAKLARADYTLGLFIHHAAVDDVSLEVLQREFGELYAAWEAGQDPCHAIPAAPATYASFAAWMEQAAREPRYAASRAYWAEQLQGAEDFDVPTDAPRTPQRTFEARQDAVPLPARLARELASFAAERRATPFVVFAAALSVLASRMAGAPDVVLATPWSLRHGDWLDRPVGFFVNTIPLRVRVGTAPSFTDVMEAVQETVYDAMDHAHVPYDEIVVLANPARDLTRPPLTPVAFQVLEPAPGAAQAGGLRLARMPARSAVSEFDLVWELTDGPDWQITASYTADVFKPSSVARMGEELAGILMHAVRAPDRPIAVAGQGRQVARGGRASDLRDIESAARAVPGVADCHVEAREGAELTAYAALDDESVTPERLRAALAQRLPHELVPAWFVLLDRLPRGHDGTVDQAALDALGWPGGEGQPSPAEEQVRAVWEEHLGRPVPDVRESFFNVDGNSLIAVRIAAGLQNSFGRPVPVRTIFERPTIRELARYLETHPDAPGGGPGHDEAGPRAAREAASRLGADLAAATDEEWQALTRITDSQAEGPR